MRRYLLKRLLLVIPTTVGAVTLVFFLIRLTPGDPAEVLLGDFASPETVAELQRQFGLDNPIFTQYVAFLWNAITLDFSVSYATQRPALQQLITVFPYSLQLAVAGIVVAIAIGVPAGVIAAISHNKWIDSGTMVSALALVSVPNFYLGILLYHRLLNETRASSGHGCWRTGRHHFSLEPLGPTSASYWWRQRSNPCQDDTFLVT